MRLLVEALNVLRHLTSAVSIINSKISPEMKKVIHLVTAKVSLLLSSLLFLFFTTLVLYHLAQIVSLLVAGDEGSRK
jgi:hypothetical protein